MSDGIVKDLLGFLNEKKISKVSVLTGPPWVPRYTNRTEIGLKELHTLCEKFVREKMFIRVEYNEGEQHVVVLASLIDCFK